MRPKRRRLYFVLAGMSALAVAFAGALAAVEDNLVFFNSPPDVYAKEVPQDRRFRLGGLVEEQSVARSQDGLTTTFRVTDLNRAVPVAYTGILPDLFREGQGIVADGRLTADGTFVADNVLAKHDENYMPPEVAEALKKSGQWKGGSE